jgi:hypothetical protein
MGFLKQQQARKKKSFRRQPFTRPQVKRPFPRRNGLDPQLKSISRFRCIFLRDTLWFW